MGNTGDVFIIEKGHNIPSGPDPYPQYVRPEELTGTNAQMFRFVALEGQSVFELELEEGQQISSIPWVNNDGAMTCAGDGFYSWNVTSLTLAYPSPAGALIQASVIFS